ncbi:MULTISPECIES: amino acid ABC transporter permease [unclassified Beijerinckia]|uniref:amino acid ABC transporter permease n=1 Tax=unclassified Beijerinckia TaxID=2638183 RepID=UPI0008994EEC|nr:MULTISPECIES: amino acid ABC transporter permease [unclassified Beijerinckia]MDH7795238.1 general L-amino acid transport system permease protein [Beijerinckia sp. GAS462]SEB93227.1 amino acid ABC transporter membrane protein 2, PAAT family [Beijerinckia sp. 28-YEA-48]
MAEPAVGQSRPFVPSPDLPPPASMRGLWGWMRANLFASPFSVFLTLGSIAFLVWYLPELIRYLFIDAVWSAPDGAACRAPGAGACWAYVSAKLSFFTYGAYPRDQVWRVDLVLGAGGALALWLLWPNVRGKGLAAILFFIVYPLLAFGLLTGRTPFPFPVPDAGTTGIWIAITAIVALLVIGLALTLMRQRRFGIPLLLVGAWWLVGVMWPILNLSLVGTDLWGGIFVSLLVATVGIVFSLPCGVLLALGRRSRLPVIRFLSIMLIEIVRGVPLITVLFMANTMLPLFVPEAWSPDRLLRPLIGVALFASVYMAEVVRGGLEAVPRGQYEAAQALGLNWRNMMLLVSLPQALTAVIPGIVNSFIALFKDTTLVAVVGIFDFLRAVDVQRLDPAWAGPTISTTGYIFAAAFYFIFCFAMSRYSLMMERRLAAGRKR